MKQATWLAPYRFDPSQHERELRAIVEKIEPHACLDDVTLRRILVQHPKNGNAFFSKSEIIRGYRYLQQQGQCHGDAAAFLAKLRAKPVRTGSGVAPVAVLTQPWPCPGHCIFCPSDLGMPKSY